MKLGPGTVKEIVLLDNQPAARVSCAAALIPAPGQYVLCTHASDSPLADSIFSGGIAADGFVAAPPIPAAWKPGMTLNLRGPLGRGFSVPSSVRRVALIASDNSPRRLLPLIESALAQGASIVLLSDYIPDNLPAQVEVQPTSAWIDALMWSDFAAFDMRRESLPYLREKLESVNQTSVKGVAQVLIRAPMPCGGIAECGVCAVTLKHDWKMACRDGPVFDLLQLH